MAYVSMWDSPWWPQRVDLSSLGEPSSRKISTGCAEEQVEREEMEGACAWHKEPTHRLRTGLNQAGVRVMSLRWDSGCWGYVGYGKKERGHVGSWSCVHA